MKPSLTIGITGQLTTQVGPGNTITLGDDQQATVFSTPAMINLMEHAAREALRPHLDFGEESVGVDVQITHSSATPPKTQVTATATATAVDKNLIRFEIVAHDDWGEIGRGTHRRAVIETTKFAQRLAQQKPIRGESSSAALPNLPAIDCQQHGEVLRITLNRPQKRNAITAEMTTALEQVVDWLDRNPESVRAVIVSGAENTFCAGDDVGDLPDDRESAKQLSLRRGELYQRMTRLPQAFIAAIDGLTLGGGLVFAAACDVRIATHRAKFGLPEATLGWPPNYGMGILQSVIGRGRTVELALGGKPIDACRAESIGLINRVVAARNLDAAAHQLANELAGMPAAALAATKALLEPGTAWSDVQAGEMFVDCLSRAEARRSIDRFRSS